MTCAKLVTKYNSNSTFLVSVKNDNFEKIRNRGSLAVCVSAPRLVARGAKVRAQSPGIFGLILIVALTDPDENCTGERSIITSAWLATVMDWLNVSSATEIPDTHGG